MSQSVDTAREAAARSASEALVRPCRRAFAEFGGRALWNIAEAPEPTRTEVLAITRQLRTEGGMNARLLAEQVEQTARADL